MEERKRKSDENIIDIAGKEDVPFKQLQKIIEHESWVLLSYYPLFLFSVILSYFCRNNKNQK